MNKNPYDVIHSRYVTEKATLLQNLQHMASNPSLSRCNSPKYVFIVNLSANKQEIARAIEAIYSEKKIRVKRVNTLTIKPKERRMRGKKGYTSQWKKAIVTLEQGDVIDEKV